MTKVYVFPGQGSQRKGMGAQLFDAFPELTAQADTILGYSIKELCLNGPDQQLRDTRYTQPALFVVNALTYLDKLRQDPTTPDYVAGHSLGEYNALCAAGVFDFATGVQLVRKRGELMSQAPSGTMAAVLNCPEATVQRILREHGLERIDVANFNTPSQLVLAGLRDDILKAQPLFDFDDVKYIPLNVGAAFHSRYMQPAMEEFRRFLQDFSFTPPNIPVISNVHARPYLPEQLKTNLAEQICRPVRWTESIRYLMGKGMPTFEELGPGNVLTRLIADIQRTATPLVVEDEPPPDTSPRPHSRPVTVPAAQPTKASSPAPAPHLPKITPERLGSEEFKRDYGLRYAYASGAMYKGIASKDIVVRMGRAGFLSFYGTGGVRFLLGADFVLTGSINQCTAEAGMSDVVKDMLQDINVQDTDYAPAGDMFEIGAKIQVMKRGVFFPARANKLYNLWREHDSLASIDAQTAKHIQEKYFRRSFEEVYADTRNHYLTIMPGEIDKAERNPKHKMALVFRSYFIHTINLALAGNVDRRVDFQVHCGPSLGAFNQWVKGTELEDWRRRHPDQIGEMLMQETADHLNRRFQAFHSPNLGGMDHESLARP